MSDFVVYHNPRCSKSRKALAYLTDRDAAVEVIRYLEAPPTSAELDRVCTLLGLAPEQLVRPKEAQRLGISLSVERTREQWLELLSATPVLIERPIVVRGRSAVVGRPPERVLDLL